MKVLCCHPSGLMYTEIYLRLEPLGVELMASAARKAGPEKIGDELQSIHERGVFIVDDVAFIHPEHGFAIGREIERRKIRKKYYLETRGDVLLRNKDVFRYWQRLGLEYMFLGVEAIDEQP
jgi:hypothetical protein